MKKCSMHGLYTIFLPIGTKSLCIMKLSNIIRQLFNKKPTNDDNELASLFCSLPTTYRAGELRIIGIIVKYGSDSILKILLISFTS